LKRLKREGDYDVEAMLNLSYELLDADLKKYSRALGIFTAPFAKVSAQAVLGIADADELDEVLGKLMARSFLNTQSSQAVVTDLYSLHDLTRLYAIQKLLDENEYEETLTRYAEHFLNWASEADDLYEKGSENILVGLAQFRFIWIHLYSAYERCLPEQKTRPQSADRWLSNFPGRCAYVLDLHLPPREKTLILQTALDAARRLGDKQTEGVHLGNLGLAYAALGDARKAIEFYEQYLSIAREFGDRRGEGNALGNLGIAYADLGHARKAIEFYEQALTIAREIGDRRGEGAALGNLGNVYADLGDARKAIEFYEQQLIIVREIGDRHGEGNALGNLGIAYKNLGDARKAIEFYEQALIIDREIGDRRGEGADLANLGLAYKNLGEKEKARKVWQESLIIYRAIESPHVSRVEKWLADLE
jgi:tetratricopeptide (TPR) repeat protein